MILLAILGGALIPASIYGMEKFTESYEGSSKQDVSKKEDSLHSCLSRLERADQKLDEAEASLKEGLVELIEELRELEDIHEPFREIREEYEDILKNW